MRLKIKINNLLKFGSIAIIAFLSQVQIARAQSGTIPFELFRNQIYVKVKVNNSDTLRFLFDTGGSGILLDSLTAENAGVPLKGRKVTKAGGAGGTQRSISIKHQNLGLPGNQSLKDVEFTLMSLSGMNSGAIIPVDGILGADLMQHYVTAIDFKNNKLQCYQDIKSVDTKGYTAVPFRFFEGLEVPRIPVNITLDNNESFSGNAIFDTGMNESLLVFAPFRNYYHLNAQLGRTLPSTGKGLNAATTDDQAVIKAVRFNGFSFNQMAIKVSQDEKAGKSSKQLGLLGLEVIKRFDVILDYKHKMIYLKANEHYSEPFPTALIDYQMIAEWTQKRKAANAIPRPEEAESKAFLEANKSKPGVVVLPSGLQYKIIKAGNGPKPALTDQVSVQYAGTMVNGRLFDASFLRGTPTTLKVNGVIPGWTEALQLMPAGSKWELYIPAELAYGAHTLRGTFLPNSALVFEIELLDIVK